MKYVAVLINVRFSEIVDSMKIVGFQLPIPLHKILQKSEIFKYFVRYHVKIIYILRFSLEKYVTIFKNLFIEN